MGFTKGIPLVEDAKTTQERVCKWCRTTRTMVPRRPGNTNVWCCSTCATRHTFPVSMVDPEPESDGGEDFNIDVSSLL